MAAPAFPKIQQLLAWWVALARNLVAASPHHDQMEVRWIKEIEGPTFDALKDSEARCQILDSQLASALIKTLPEGLRVKVQAKEMEAFANGRTITGRHNCAYNVRLAQN